MLTDVLLKDRFKGCLLDLAHGDALGARFEDQTAEYIARIPSRSDGIRMPGPPTHGTPEHRRFFSPELLAP
jgi:hypothetical protein